jgi:hypothetical protein
MSGVGRRSIDEIVIVGGRENLLHFEIWTLISGVSRLWNG